MILTPGRPDVERTALEEERDFLLASLRDLEAEHAAGDMADGDYQTLRDDYTARAASVLRVLAGETAGEREGGLGEAADDAADDAAGGRPAGPLLVGVDRSRRRWRTTAIVGGIALVGVLAAWALTASSGSRGSGQPITGSFAGPKAPGAAPGPTIDPRLTQAGQLVEKGKITDALKLYDQILKARPTDPTALANEGWLIAQAGAAANRQDLVDRGLAQIAQAEKVDPSFPAPHFFRGYLLLQAKHDPAGAVTELRLYLGLVDPSSPGVPQVEQLLKTALTEAGPSAPPGPNAPTTTSAP